MALISWILELLDTNRVRERVLLEIVYYLNCCPFKFGNKLVIRDAQSKTSMVFSVEVPNTEQQVKA